MRSPSAFQVCGLLLVASTVAGLFAPAVGTPGSGYGFGYAGLTAVALGWAAYGRTVLRAAGRAAIGWVVVSVAIAASIVLVLFGGVGAPFLPPDFEVYRNIQGEDETTFASVLQGVGTMGILVAAVAATAGLFGVAAQRYATAPRHRLIRLIPGALAITPALLQSAAAFDDRERVWFATCVLSLAWLVWAMRRARSQRLPGRPRGARLRNRGNVLHEATR